MRPTTTATRYDRHGMHIKSYERERKSTEKINGRKKKKAKKREKVSCNREKPMQEHKRGGNEPLWQKSIEIQTRRKHKRRDRNRCGSDVKCALLDVCKGLTVVGMTITYWRRSNYLAVVS